MKESPESFYDYIDSLLDEVEQSTNNSRLLTEIDSLTNEIDTALDNRKKEVKEWPETQKRKEAADSNDPYVLSILSLDENPNVRILSACNPNVPASSLKKLMDSGDDYTLMVIAHNPNATPDILDRITELSSEPEVLEAVKGNPNTSEVTKYKINNKR